MSGSKISLKADGLELGKDKLTTSDIVAGKGASPKFEIPFTASKPGDYPYQAIARQGRAVPQT